MTRYKTLYDRNTAQYFQIKKGEIVYSSVPILIESNKTLNFTHLSLYTRNYLTKHGQIRYLNLKDVTYKPLFAHKPSHKRWTTEDIKIVEENIGMGLKDLHETYFSDVSYNSLAGFVFRLNKQKEEV